MKHQRSESLRKLQRLQKGLPEEEEDLGQIFTIRTSSPPAETGEFPNAHLFLPFSFFLPLHLATCGNTKRATTIHPSFLRLPRVGGNLDLDSLKLNSGLQQSSAFWLGVRQQVRFMRCPPPAV